MKPFLPTLLLVLATLPACVSERPITVEYAPLTPAPATAPPPQGGAAVSVLTGPKDLPDGITMNVGPITRLRDRLALEPDFPTAQDPHRVLGGVAASGKYKSEAELVDACRAEAARRGGNAIFVVEKSHNTVGALVLRLSSATSAETFPPSAEVLGQALPPAFAAYAPEGEPQPLDLGAPAALHVQAARGDCFALHLALDADAKLDRGLPGLSATRTASSGIQTSSPGHAELSRRQRSYAFSLGCAFGAGATTLRVGPERRPLGRGHARLQLLIKRVDEAEIARQEREDAKAWEAARARSAAQSSAACSACFPFLVFCRTPDNRSSCSAYTSCLAKRYVRHEECSGRP